VWEDHFYPEIIDPQTGESAGGEKGRTGLHVADQGSAADDSLSHADLTAAAAPTRARSAHREDHRPL